MADTTWRTLVTGASSGIGAEYARALRARGERVVLVARRAERLAALARSSEASPRRVAVTASTSPARGRRRRAPARSSTSAGIVVDGLVNCAGLGHTAPFASQCPEVIRAMFDLNVRAVVELTRAFLPADAARGRGRIVNVASNAAFQPIPYLGVYAATKAFVLSFTEALADELGAPGVRVQALCPGITATEFLDVAATHRGPPA